MTTMRVPVSIAVGPMFRSAVVTLVWIVLGFFQRLPAEAQSSLSIKYCANEGAIYISEFSVEVCTSLIQEASNSSAELSVLFSFRCKNYIDEAQTDRALQDCAEAIWLDKKNALAYEIRGLGFEQAYQYQLAAANFAQVIALQPSNVRAWEGLCRSQLSLGQDRLAISACQEALRLRSVDKKGSILIAD